MADDPKAALKAIRSDLDKLMEMAAKIEGVLESKYEHSEYIPFKEVDVLFVPFDELARKIMADYKEATKGLEAEPVGKQINPDSGFPRPKNREGYMKYLGEQVLKYISDLHLAGIKQEMTVVDRAIEKAGEPKKKEASLHSRVLSRFLQEK